MVGGKRIPGEPLGLGQFFLLEVNAIGTGQFSKKAEEQTVCHHPGLGFVKPEVVHLKPGLLQNLSPDGLLNGFPNFVEAGYQGISPETPAGVLGQQEPVPMAYGHNHSRANFRVDSAATGGANQGPFQGAGLQRPAAGAAEPVSGIPPGEALSHGAGKDRLPRGESPVIGNHGKAWSL